MRRAHSAGRHLYQHRAFTRRVCNAQLWISTFVASEKVNNTCADCDAKVDVIQGILFANNASACAMCDRPAASSAQPRVSESLGTRGAFGAPRTTRKAISRRKNQIVRHPGCVRLFVRDASA